MDKRAIIGIIESTLRDKRSENSHYIVYTFYEIRVKYNLSEEETNTFLSLIQIKLQNENYSVYFTGSEFTYKNNKIIVQPNELMIAVKD